MISLAPNVPMFLRDLCRGYINGNSTGNTSPDTDWTTIVSGTKIGIMLDFDLDGTATVTAYKDGVRACVMSTGSLRGPLCPAVWFSEPGQSVQLISSM